MFSAAELIETLHARDRRRFPLNADRPFGGFPPTWRAWFLSISERVGAITGAPAAEYCAVFLARPPRTPPQAIIELGRWQGYASLARQQWEPAPRDQRGVRRIAAVSSACLHLLFALVLLWVGFVAIGDAPPESREAGQLVQVEFIGVGTPAETGGAAAPGETDAPAVAAAGAPAQAAAATALPSPASSASAERASSSDQPPQPAETASEQPLMVTESTAPDIDFTLPAPVQRELTLPQLQIATPELTTEIARVETFEPRPSVRVLQPPTVSVPTPTVPTLRTEVVEVQVRQPLPQVQVRAVPQTALRTPQLREPTLRTTPGEIQLRPRPAPANAAMATSTPTPSPPTPVPGSAAAAGRAPGASTMVSPSAAAPGGRPQTQGTGRSTSAVPSGAGPAPSPRPGAAPSATRGDDWGDSNRNVPGSSTAGRSPGLFNSDGSVRLPGDGGRAGGGLPPGTIIEDFEKIDRMGTWLKRPPLDYTPSRFDRFWTPNRTLLEEWVSRGIKKVAVPIPGTSKRIECTVSLLQAGGGCTIVDPNLQDQEAIARPPPDVPFKPELQEDKNSLPSSRP